MLGGRKRWLWGAGLLALAGLAHLARAAWRRRRRRLPFFQLTGRVADTLALRARPTPPVFSRTRASGLQLAQLVFAPKLDRLHKVDPYLPPYDEGEYAMELGQTHRLLFHALSPHPLGLVLPTAADDPPWEELGEDDFFWGFIVAAAVGGLCFYGSDPTAGAAPVHKALHVVAGLDTPVLRRIGAELGRRRPVGEALREENVVALPAFAPFRVICVALKPCDRRADPLLHAQYLQRVYQLCRRGLEAEGLPAPFNLIFAERWMLVALRKAGSAAGVPVDALGLLGSVVAADERQARGVRELGAAGLWSALLLGREEAIAASFAAG